MAGSLGNLAQHLGPFALGTQKETNPAQSSTAGQIRNMGISDAYQFGTLAYTNGTANSNLTYTQTNTASPVGTVILPAGAYIGNINIDVTTAFNAGTTNLITIALSPTSATAGTTIATVGTTTSIPTGRFSLGIVSTATFTQTNTAYWANVSNGQTTPTDQFVLAWFTQTGTAATTGACTIAIEYVLRFPDGSWYQQTPQSPITSTTIIPFGSI
jgi:hypothetical protein